MLPLLLAPQVINSAALGSPARVSGDRSLCSASPVGRTLEVPGWVVRGDGR